MQKADCEEVDATVRSDEQAVVGMVAISFVHVREVKHDVLFSIDGAKIVLFEGWEGNWYFWDAVDFGLTLWLKWACKISWITVTFYITKRTAWWFEKKVQRFSQVKIFITKLLRIYELPTKLGHIKVLHNTARTQGRPLKINMVMLLIVNW